MSLELTNKVIKHLDIIKPADGEIFVIIDKKILALMNHINKSSPSLKQTEFGVYLKHYRTDYETSNGTAICYCVTPEYYVPKQTVTNVTVEFLEGRPDLSFNTVIHKHPEGCNEFSSVDDNSVNVNFPLSLLYMASKGIFRAHVNVNIEGKEAPLGVRLTNKNIIIV